MREGLHRAAVPPLEGIGLEGAARRQEALLEPLDSDVVAREEVEVDVVACEVAANLGRDRQGSRALGARDVWPGPADEDDLRAL